MISSKSTKAIVKAVYQYYHGDISAVEKGEIADSILYQTLDVFFEILIPLSALIVAKIRAVVVTTRADGDHWR